jgi:hypothetical protein
MAWLTQGLQVLGIVKLLFIATVWLDVVNDGRGGHALLL